MILLRSLWIRLLAPPEAYDGNSSCGRSDKSRIPGINAPGLGNFEEHGAARKSSAESAIPFPFPEGGPNSSSSESRARRSEVSVVILTLSSNPPSSAFIGVPVELKMGSKKLENVWEIPDKVVFLALGPRLPLEVGDKAGVGRAGVVEFLVRELDTVAGIINFPCNPLGL